VDIGGKVTALKGTLNAAGQYNSSLVSFAVSGSGSDMTLIGTVNGQTLTGLAPVFPRVRDRLVRRERPARRVPPARRALREPALLALRDQQVPPALALPAPLDRPALPAQPVLRALALPARRANGADWSHRLRRLGRAIDV